MTQYELSTYGDRIVGQYNSWAGLPGDAEACVELLAPLAGRGPALELGIGTGRIALPLAARGIEVHGIDSSRRVVAKPRAKKGGRRVRVTIGDFADVPVSGTYPLVLVVFNSLFGLLTQEEQIRCFENVASHLEPGGAFVLQCFVPDVTRFDCGQRTAQQVESGVPRGKACLLDQHSLRFPLVLHEALQTVNSRQVMVRRNQWFRGSEAFLLLGMRVPAFRPRCGTRTGGHTGKAATPACGRPWPPAYPP